MNVIVVPRTCHFIWYDEQNQFTYRAALPDMILSI